MRKFSLSLGEIPTQWQLCLSAQKDKTFPRSLQGYGQVTTYVVSMDYLVAKRREWESISVEFELCGFYFCCYFLSKIHKRENKIHIIHIRQILIPIPLVLQTNNP